MSQLTIRKLLIDLEPPLPRHWCNGDAFLTAWFNALSMSFPKGEQFFIDSVRSGFSALTADSSVRFEDEVKGFIGQEATHRHIHAKFNAHLEKQGLHKGWEARIERRQARLKQMNMLDTRHTLGITAANEHFTALFAHWLLTHPSLLQDCEPRLRLLWEWHSAEESEHRCTAFDLYQALGGNHKWRTRWMRSTTFFFLADVFRQTADNLRRDGTLWKWSTWRSAYRHLLSKQGLLRQTYAGWRAYFSPDFHPSRQSDEPSRRWLAENADSLKPVGASA
ncbi:metal-dependent hydrolase [Hydrogenophaga sp. 5NK40-0174]|uniref:metal-dependent hydrolase n=1 Tax=Hydrogenophaga sp. 5NK40-0174 TaxID=3127649 RepID=UPI00310A9809